MPRFNSPAPLIRFDNFEIDAANRELRNRGRCVRLQPKQFALLIMLAERAGQTISREEIRERIWDENTFVDFERGINFAINQIRAALGDSADSPKFIETVPRFGYKFICPVKFMEHVTPPDVLSTADPPNRRSTDDSEPFLSNAELAETLLSPIGAPVPDDPVLGLTSSAENSPSPKSPTRLIAIACSLLVLSALTIAAWHYRQALLSALSRHSANLSSSSGPRVRTIPLTYFSGIIDNPVFSADGKQIAFTWDGPEHTQENIYTLPIGGNQPYQVTHLGPAAMSLSWSPDGKFFAYVGCLDHQGGIFIVPALGGPERRLTTGPCSAGNGVPQWTHDGKSLLIEDPCGASTNWTLAIAVLSVATGEKRCLTTPPPYNFDMRFQLSPDGTKVAFVRAPSPRVGDYYVVSISGGTPIRLTTGEIQFYQLMWSGDSSRIIFYSGHPDKFGSRLVSVPAQGGAIKPELVYTVIGALSPDGRRVAYTDSNLPEDRSIWKVVFDIPGGRVLSHHKIIDSTLEDVSPQLSPDGKRIAFSSARSGSLEIWTTDSEGADPVKLTSFGGELAGCPHWSPDGKQIVLDRRPGTVAQLWLMDADGSNLRPFIASNADNDVPSWSRDGRSIYFESLRSGERQVWRQPLSADYRSAEGPPIQLTRMSGFSALESYDGKTVFYTRLGADGIWSIPSSGGPEISITDSPRDGLWGHWAISETGLYFLSCHTSPHCTFEFYNFKTRKLTLLFQIAADPRDSDCGFTASRDGRTFIYTLFRPPNNYIAMTELLP